MCSKEMLSQTELYNCDAPSGVCRGSQLSGYWSMSEDPGQGVQNWQVLDSLTHRTVYAQLYPFVWACCDTLITRGVPFFSSGAPKSVIGMMAIDVFCGGHFVG